MNFAGIDPGISGAIAFYDAMTGAVDIIDMPTLQLSRNGKNKREIDAAQLAELFWSRHCGHVTVELVTPMPTAGPPDSTGRRRQQGAASGFAFGKGFGVVIGVLAAVGVPTTFVAAAKWKKALDVPASKDGARARASQLLPQASGLWPLKKHDGRAESALLALHGCRELGGIAPQRPPREAAVALAARAGVGR